MDWVAILTILGAVVFAILMIALEEPPDDDSGDFIRPHY